MPDVKSGLRCISPISLMLGNRMNRVIKWNVFFSILLISGAQAMESKNVFADKSFSDVIAEGVEPILVARITKASSADEGSKQEIDHGILLVSIIRELTFKKWHGPLEIDVNYRQFKTFDKKARYMVGWNKVDPKPGNILVLALKDVAESDRHDSNFRSITEASSVIPLKGTDDPVVIEIQKAVQIESEKDTKIQHQLLYDGIYNGGAFLSGFCHYAIGRLQRIPRKEAIALESGLLFSESQSTTRKQAAEINLELELWNDEDGNDPLNKKILETFLNALLNVPEDDADLFRAKLMKGIVISGKKDLRSVFTALISDAEVSKEANWLLHNIDLQ